MSLYPISDILCRLILFELVFCSVHSISFVKLAVIDNFIQITLHTIIALAAGGYKMLVTFLSPTLPYSGNRVNHTLVKCTVAKLIIPPSLQPNRDTEYNKEITVINSHCWLTG